jgi:hypothetical protein
LDRENSGKLRDELIFDVKGRVGRKREEAGGVFRGGTDVY